MKSFILENAFVLTNNGARDFLHTSVRVVDGRIAEIKKNIRARAGEKKISLAGQVLIPGFIQTHTHLCQTLFRNLADDLELLDWLSQKIWRFEGAHSAKSLRASARLGIAELLSGGTTTILDMGTVHHTDSIFQAVEELGIRAFVGKCLMDRDDMPEVLRESTASALQENRALAERWHKAANDRIRYAHAPRFVLSCTEHLLREVNIMASKHGQLIHTHASENRSEIERVRELHDCENIEYFEKLGLTNERLVLAHCIHLSETEKKILARTRTNISHCPSSNLKLASGIAPVPDLRQRGICVSLGADGAPCNNNLNMFQEMRLASLIQKPLHGPRMMPAQEVFEMATLEGARALGISADIGSIEVGKKADLVALDLQHLSSAVGFTEKTPEPVYSSIVYSASPENITHTWVDGRVVYRRGARQAFLRASHAEIVAEALREQKKLLASVQSSN